MRGQVAVAILLLAAAVLSAGRAAAQTPPNADPGGPYAGNVGEPIAFDGTGSSDPDGPITYLWSFGDGGTATGATPTHTYAFRGVFVVTLTVTDEELLSDVAFTSATINGAPTADVNGPYSGNQGVPIAFSSEGSNDPDGDPLAYEWNFGDGSTSTAANPSHTYATGGAFNVNLTVTDPGGLSDSDATTAHINSSPTAEANGPYSANENDPVSFSSEGSSDPDGDPLTYLWNFGDGASSTAANPTHSYATGGNYTAILTVRDPGGLEGQDTAGVDISGTPTADANGPYSGNQGVLIAFSSAGSNDPDGDPLTYLWSFGDGSTSTAANPNHTYSTGGHFDVTLTVRDPGGLTDTDGTTADINRPPNAEAGGPYSGNQGQPIAFNGSGSSDPDGDLLTYRWDFGDGATGTGATPSHAYTEGGVYTATLTVSDPGGLQDSDTAPVNISGAPTADANGPYSGNLGVPIVFSSEGSNDPDGDPLTYEWSFGDGASSTAANPSHTYVTGGHFNVTLTVRDPGGLTDSDGTTADVNRPPTAEANGPYAGNVGQPILFSSDGTSDPDGDPLTYSWSFGDGASSTAANPSHTYATGGVFNVTLAVRDPGGLNHSDATTADINRPPTAEAGGPYSGNQGQSIAFNGTGSSDPDGDPLTYHWDFGDGSTATGTTPSHTYTQGGVYTATLTVRDPGSLEDQDTAPVNVSGAPTANANGPYSGNEGVAIAFSSDGSSDPDGDPLTYLWSFGDGTSSTAADPNHTYSTGGLFDVVLTVTDPGGLDDSDATTADVTANEITVTAPKEGETFFETGTTDITWTSTGAITAVNLEYRLSPAPPDDWVTISNNQPNDGSFTWTLPEVTEDKPRVQVRVRDAADPNSTEDESEEFAILNRTIVLTAPESGSIWSEASTHNIQWVLTGPAGDVRLEFQRRPTDEWETIAVVPASDGTYSWLVPPVTADMPQAKVRIYETAPIQFPLIDESEIFTIQNRAIVVTLPAGDEEISEHAQTSITWTSAGLINDVRIVLVHPAIQDSVITASTPNDGQFDWFTPEVTGDATGARVRITAAGPPGDLARGVSQPFTLVDRSFDPRLPQAGEILCEADTVTVLWESRGSIPAVHLEYRENSGAGWTRVVSNLPNSGSYLWNTPDLEATSDQVQLRILQADDAQVQGIWTAFTLRNRTIAITRPSGGELFSEGDAVPVIWSSTCLDSVRLEARLGPAEPWELQNIGVYPDLGQIIWTVIRVDQREDDVQVRLSDASDPTVFAVSQPFTVLNRILDVVRPTVTDRLSETETFTIDWDWVGTLQRVDVDYRLGPALPWVVLADNAVNTGTLSWTVPLVDQDFPEAQVRVTDSNNGTNFDNGDLFTVVNRALVVVSPAAGDSVTEVTTATILWNTSGLVPDVKISYRPTPADPWQVLAASTPNTGSYDWSVPEVGAPIQSAQVRVEHATIPDIAAESQSFVILDRTFAILSPTAGEQWPETTQQTIRWNAGGHIAMVTIELLVPGQAPQALFASTPNDGEELWVVPELTSTLADAQIRVFDPRPPAAGASSGPFTLVNRTITLVAPAPVPYVQWRIGSIQDVIWQTTGIINAVTIELEREPGEVEVLTASTPNDGSFTWQVTGPETFTALLRVRDVDAAHVVGTTVFPLALYDLFPPEHCADFDQSAGVTLDEVIRVESIIVGAIPGGEADSLAADCNNCPGAPELPTIDLCDLLEGVDEMIETEAEGRGRPFVDAGAELGEAQGVVVGVGSAAAGYAEFTAIVPVEIESQFPLAGLLVEFEVKGGSAEPLLGRDGGELVLTQVATGGRRLIATVRRAGTGPDIAAGSSQPLALGIRPLPGETAGEITVEVLRAEAVAARDLALLPVHLERAEAAVVPLRLGLAQNRPNPFNPTTVVPFALPASGRVQLDIYDVSGRLVRRLVDAGLPAGFHTVAWDGRDERGLTVASGIYLYSIRTGGEILTRKMTMLR